MKALGRFLLAVMFGAIASASFGLLALRLQSSLGDAMLLAFTLPDTTLTRVFHVPIYPFCKSNFGWDGPGADFIEGLIISFAIWIVVLSTIAYLGLRRLMRRPYQSLEPAAGRRDVHM
jgi:hypothetical protein